MVIYDRVFITCLKMCDECTEINQPVRIHEKVMLLLMHPNMDTSVGYFSISLNLRFSCRHEFYDRTLDTGQVV